MGASQTKEEEEEGQKKELEKGKDDPNNKKLEGGANFKGPSDPSNRKTTDCLCCLLICAMWFSLTILGFIFTGVIESETMPAGNPAKLTHAMDYNANICGVSTEDKATGTNIEVRPYAYLMPNGQRVCIKECPTKTSLAKYICQYDLQSTVDNDPTASLFGYSVIGAAYTLTYQCMPEYATVVAPYYVCVFDTGSSENKDIIDAGGGNPLGDPPETSAFDDLQNDIIESWWAVLLFGFVVAALVGFLCLRVLRLPFFLEFLIWGCIFGVALFLFLIGIMLKTYTADVWRAEDPQTHTNGEIAAVEGLGYFFLALTALWCCLICCLRKKIFLAIGITKESAKALGAMPVLILFPVIQTAGLVAFSCVWFVYLIYNVSSGEIVKTTYSYNGVETETASMEYSEDTRKAYYYLIFCWFWTSEFIEAIGQIVVAMAVAMWYFTKDKSTIGSTTVFKAIRLSLRYHLGTAAFGSLIIAIIKTLKFMLKEIEKKVTTVASRGGAVGRGLAKAITCCIFCCLECMERCAKFLNKNAYIQTAIFSYSFCTAARKAFFLILRNIMLIGAVAIVSEFVLTLILVLIPVGTTFIAYMVYTSMELTSVIGPTLFTFFFSYFTAKKFVETFGMVISTILQCYVADTELFEPEDRFAGGSLKAAVSNGNSAARKGASSKKVAPEKAVEEKS